MKYTYFHRDFFLNNGEYPLSGKHYAIFLQTCVKYSWIMSLLVSENKSFLENELEEWEVLPKDIPFVGKIESRNRRFYYSNRAIISIFLSFTSDFFEFGDGVGHMLSGDPVFYREDGTVFMDSVIHEGECSIYPRDKEDISNLLAQGHWLPINANGKPEVPARYHQLPPPYREVILKDPLYNLLMEFYRSSYNRFVCNTIDDLTNLIYAYRPPIHKSIASNPYLSFLPSWYIAFELFILAQCNAKTSDNLTEAFRKAGYNEVDAYHEFFNMLHKYVIYVCKTD